MAEYDLLIKNGTIIDGMRMPAYRGDIGIRDGKIVAMGNVQRCVDVCLFGCPQLFAQVEITIAQ